MASRHPVSKTTLEASKGVLNWEKPMPCISRVQARGGSIRGYRLFICNTSENLIFQMQGGAAHFRIARISEALRRNIVFCDALRRLAHNP
jgi:hypothetical protein